jgi:hypothetical protein
MANEIPVEGNRFDVMFSQHKLRKVGGGEPEPIPVPPAPKKKKNVADFNDIMANDLGFAAAMQAVHENMSGQKPTVQSRSVPEQPADTPSITHTSIPSATPSTTPSPGALPLPAPLHPSAPPVESLERYPERSLQRPPVETPFQYPTQHPQHHPVELHDQTERAILSLAKSAGIILIYLARYKGPHKRKFIADATGILPNTVKDVVKTLRLTGFIDCENYVAGNFRGFTCTISEHLYTEFIKRRWNEFSAYIQGSPLHPDGHPHGSPLQYPLSSPVTPSFSSSSKDIKTTTPFEQDKVQVLTGSEMAYWVEQGLKDRQVLKWCEEFYIEPIEIRQQLAWARWDLVNNGKENEVKKDAINWFYGVLKRSAGCYPPAKGYQTPTHIRAARLREQIESDVKARYELETLETEVRFQAVLSDPEGAEYRDLLSGLPDAMIGIKGRALESILRERFLAREG